MEGKQGLNTGRVDLQVDSRACCQYGTADGGQPPTLAGAVVSNQGPDCELAAVFEEVEDGISFDEALCKYVGEFGKGQVLVYLWACLLQVPNAVLILLLVFVLGDPISSKAWSCTSPAPLPAAAAATTLGTETAAQDASAQCWAVYQSPSPSSAEFCNLDRSQWSWTQPGRHLVSRFDLVCGGAFKAQIANSFFFLGYLIGSGLCGVLADLWGRKAVAFGAGATAALFTAAALGATNYWVLLVLRLMTGVGVAGQALGSYLLATEMLGPSWRGGMGIILQCFFILGEFVLVIFALAFSSWRGQFGAGAVLCTASLLLWPLLPESGRWLHVQGRTDEAMQILADIARLNGSQPPQEPLAKISGRQQQQQQQQQQVAALSDGSKPAVTEGAARASGLITPVSIVVDACSTPQQQLLLLLQQQQEKPSLLGALRNRHVARRFFILSYSWMVMCMAYYGISFALAGLGGSLLVSFSIAAVAELPSYLLAAWAIDHIGRHNTMAAGMLLGGAACIGCALMPGGAGRAGLAAIGKFGIAASFGVASIYTSELFPTTIRSAVLGCENQAARVGGIIAPFIVTAGTAAGGSAANLVPFLTFGIASVLSGLLIFTLPETLGVPLPDTLQDMNDNIASVFTHKTWQVGGFKAATKSMFKARVVGGRRAPHSSSSNRLAAAEPILTDRQQPAAPSSSNSSNVI